jgi:AcrR family transcriptional regulator
MLNKRGRGRPAGGTDARAQILDVARRRFRTDGYERVTLRSIAAEANVDVALIGYHFGSKKGLFGAALALSANPAEMLAQELAGPLNSLPQRILLTVLDAWDDPQTGPSLRAFLDAALRDPDLMRLFREMLSREIVARIADRLSGADATARAALAASQIAGLIMARYVIAVEPVASMTAAELAERVAPVFGAALVGARGRRLPPGADTRRAGY